MRFTPVSPLNKVLVGAVLVLLLALVGVVAWREWFTESPFYAVYLRTGDLYFGKLTRFPSFGLTQVYLLQVNRENQQNPLSIQRFRDVFWGPEDTLTINRDDVVWFTKLRSDSQLAQLIKTNPTLATPLAQPGQGAIGNREQLSPNPNQLPSPSQQPGTSPQAPPASKNP